MYLIVPSSVTSLGREGVGMRGCYTPRQGRTQVNLSSGLRGEIMGCLKRNKHAIDRKRDSCLEVLALHAPSMTLLEGEIYEECTRRWNKGHVPREKNV